MPFAKRTVEPQRLLRRAEDEDEEEDAELRDLSAFSNLALSRSLRQLSDLAKHACSLFQELEHELVSTNLRVCALRQKMNVLQARTGELDPKQEAVPLSDLDTESKLTEHFQTPWRLQRNIFLPSTRPACLEELHRHATQSLRAMHRDAQQRQESERQESERQSQTERRVTITISSVPSNPSPQHSDTHLSTETTERDIDTQSTQTQDSDSEGVGLGIWPKCPVPNVPSTLDKQTNWAGSLPLPTPEEKMKTDTQVVTSCIVPINVTEEGASAASPSAVSALLRVGFDREASVRCSLVHSQSVLQRRRKLRRRKTITGIPRRVQQDFDSDESPGARERNVIVHTSSENCQEDLPFSRLRTKDSGCQTEEILVSGGAPSRRRIRGQRGQTVCVSHSTGNISSLPDISDSMFNVSGGSRLRSRSLPREGGRLTDDGHDDSDEEDDEELSPFEAEGFLPVPGEHVLKYDEESTDDQTIPEGHHSSLKFLQKVGSREEEWIDGGGQTIMPRKTDMGSCEISSSSDTFSSPIHSVSNAGVLTSQIDHKEDHQSSSGNWSGSSSTCPSQTSETLPPAASPPLTGSSHCDSELSLNAVTTALDDSTCINNEPYPGDRLQGLRNHRTSTAAEMLEDAGVSITSEGEWGYSHYGHDIPCHSDLSPERSRTENILECPSFTSIATYESYTDRPPSEKADTASHYSVDAEGYYTSMHFDCGLKGSKSFTYNYASLEQREAEYQTNTLGRHSLSLKKPKVKPSPPKRSSSLRKLSSHLADNNQPKTAGEQTTSMSSEERIIFSSHLESQEPLGAWGVESSAEIPEVTLLGSTETHSFKDEGAVQSDYADLWLLNDLKSNDPYRSLSNSSTATGTTVIECIKSQESSESQTSQSGSRATTPSLPSVETEFRLPSPEKLIGLASPSSGYSSQSETPTSSLPTAFFPNTHPMSPTCVKRKPKVPERKSSLASLNQFSSKRDLELPIIPPTHLDLSALPNVSKLSVHKNQLQIFHTSKQKAATLAEDKSESLASPASSDHLAITPKILRSIHLRPVGISGERSDDQPCTDTATRPKCHTVTFSNPTSNNKSQGSRKPPPYRPLLNEPISQDNYESLFTPVTGKVGDSIASHFSASNGYDRLAPSALLTSMAFKAQTEQKDLEDDTFENTQERTQEVSSSEDAFLSSTREVEKSKSLPNDGSPGQNRLAKRSNSLDQVPDLVSHRSETLQAYLINSAGEESATSGVPTRSASQEHFEEGSTPETEGYFSRETTPSDPGVSPLTDESRTEDDNVFLSPSKSRTTEDLFAMIHRSKRKMLGRKESSDSSVRSRLPVVSGNGSAANSPTSPSTSNLPTSPPTQPGSQKAPGPIYRSAKKSSTSNEEFKLLLLKKGSRSDSSYRMSATEILKSPITPKSPGELLMEASRPLEEPLSPTQQQSPEGSPEHILSPFPKTYSEAFSIKAFPTSASSRQSRSRMPPAANSSRYSTRSRLYTAPMQAISEGETENSDGSPHDDRSS